MTAKDTLLALSVVLVMSMNLIFQKLAIEYLSPFLIGFLRSFLLIPFLLVYSKPPPNLWKYALCGFFLVAFYLVLLGYGLQTGIGACLSAFFVQFQVFFVILCCFLFLGERPSLHQVFGILIACAGVFFLHTHSSSAELPVLGVVLLIASCLSLGIGVALSKKYKVGNSLEGIVWLSVLAAPPLLLACLIFDGPTQTMNSILNVPLVPLGCIVFAAYASTLWAAYIWLSLIQRLTAASVTPFMLLVPLFSSFFAYFAFDELLSTQQILSGFIILLGVVVTQGFYKHIPTVFRRFANESKP